MRIDGSARRRFLGRAAGVGLAAAAVLTDDALARARAAVDRAGDRDPEDVARDESFWREIQLGFTLDRSIINLNNGGVSPSPRVVHEAYKRYLDVSNQSPAYHMWQVLEPNREAVRRKLAASAGCDPEELAITRNASEALQIAQLGIDLAPGDEVLTTNQDYGRMLDTWEQRVKRNGIVLKKIAFPVPPPSLADLARRFEAAVTPRTKVIHVCHITNLTGQIFPIQADLPHGARPRHPHHRRRRPRLRPFPVRAARSRVRLLRHQPAQVAAGAGRHRLPLRAPAADQGPVAADAGADAARRTTSASSRRSARTRPRPR